MTDLKAVHLIGIGGTGLSAIARVLLERRVQVSGSDRQLSPLARQLAADGVKVLIGHRPENITGAELVVRSSAIPDDNVEVLAAQAAGIPVLKRSDFLARLISGQRCIAVAGSHGKTTTTAMIAWMLSELGLDPSYIIGGVSTNLGTNAHAGRGEFFVIEADEYDHMFLGLRPDLALITNIEHDHPDCFPTPEDFYQAFVDFSGRLSPNGTLLVCAGDLGGRRLIAQRVANRQLVYSYAVADPDSTAGAPDYLAHSDHPNQAGGFSFEADCTLPDVQFHAQAVNLQLPGEHNVLNGLAALAVAHQLGLSLVQAASALERFQGTGRRFEQRGEVGGILVIDDYAHHPTQIRTNLAAARQRFPGRRLWAVWQPHTYSRTRLMAPAFAGAFDQADQVIVTEIYASREVPPPDGFSAQQVFEAIAHPAKNYQPALKQAAEYLLAHLGSGDVLIVFSAGDADQISTWVLEGLQQKEQSHV